VDRAGAIRVESARLDGPMVAGSATGRIGLAADPTLDLQLDLQVPDPNLRGMIAPLGVRLDAEGRASVRLLGTLGQPVLR
jgi:hypothetical protein